MKKESIVFDIKGKYGLFKKPYSPLSPISFPVPPPTSIYGMIGAIVGFSKNATNENYYLKLMNSGEIQVGIVLLEKVRRYRTGLNLLITKGTQFFRPKGNHLPEKGNEKQRQETPRTQIPAEFIANPKFRIFFYHSNSEIMEALEYQLIKAKRTVYTPSLGLASCIAEIEFNGNFPGKFPIEEINKPGKKRLNCVVPLSRAKIHYKQGKNLFRFRLPALMATDRTVTYYEDVVINEDTGPIEVEVESYEKIGEDFLLLIKPQATT